MARYASGYLIAIAGGVASQVLARAVGATGLAAYLLFLACVAVIVPIAALAGGGPPARGIGNAQQR